MSTRVLLQLFIVLSFFRYTSTQATSDTSAATTAAATSESTSAAAAGSTSASASESSTSAGSESTTAAAGASTTAESSATTESSSSTEAATNATTAESTTPAASPDNKICPSNSGMTDKVRIRAHEAHNYRRSRLAQGMVRNKKGRTLPQAANMIKLAYNCTLEKSAIESANRCSSIKDPNLSSGVGENYYLFPKSSASSEVGALIEGVKYWWSSLRKFGGIGHGVTYTAYNEGTPTRFFTQMAWATTKEFGCAVVSCGNYWSTVCHYSPKGNVLNHHLYEKGTACSNCPSSTFCDMNKLCAPVSTY